MLRYHVYANNYTVHFAFDFDAHNAALEKTRQLAKEYGEAVIVSTSLGGTIIYSEFTMNANGEWV